MTLSNYLEHAYRANGDRYWRRTDDAPVWFAELCYELHDGEQPDDWRYDMIASLCDIYDSNPDFDTREWAEGQNDFYYGRLFRWYADYPSRMAWIDELPTPADGDVTSEAVVHALSAGQYACLVNMADIFRQTAADNKEDA